MKNFLLKHQNEDFCVREILATCKIKQPGTYHYLLLRKSGYTTFEAIEIIATHFGINKKEIGIAGLKDEDAITEQTISLPRTLTAEELLTFNKLNKHIEITSQGLYDKSIKIGALFGNFFRVIIRNVPHDYAIESQKKGSCLVFNYFGPQRFGVPGSKKTTHEIGKALLEDDYKLALNLLSEQNSSLGDKAKESLDAESFFASLDPRQLSFYQSSYFSYLWNDELTQLIKTTCPTAKYFSSQGISYLFATQCGSLIDAAMFMPYKKMSLKENALIEEVSTRQIIIQMNFSLEVFADPLFPGQKAIAIETALPAGSYMSIATAQLIAIHAELSNQPLSKHFADFF